MSHKRNSAKRHKHHPKSHKHHPKPANSGEQPANSSAPHLVSDQERHEMIATAAYFRAAGRGFAAGDPVADWLAAEREIQEQLGPS